ncbi:MAG: F0F1 ATP synthase subunit delta [Actinobacteria bacterium]|nr:F0F1 ATP synthase subunit delta [Actinomycetota bacterium]
MVPALQGYTAAVLEALSADELAACASDLASLDRAVAGQGELRAALTDTAVAPAARRAVVAELLDTKLGKPASRLAAFAAFVASATDVPQALGWLAQRARRASEAQAEREPALGVLGARTRVGGYARALFENVELVALDAVEDELFRFARTVEANPELRRAFTDRDLRVDARIGLAKQLLEGRVSPDTIKLAAYAVIGGRARDFVGTLDFLVEETARARGWRVAKVRSAQEITGASASELADTLSKITGNKVELQVSIDPSLLAGAIVELGDLRIDSTTRGRLNVLREHLGNDDYVPKFSTNDRSEEGVA